jgi:hypothetical protein
MKNEIVVFLQAIERMLKMDMPPVRRAELENLRRIWKDKLK